MLIIVSVYKDLKYKPKLTKTQYSLQVVTISYPEIYNPLFINAVVLAVLNYTWIEVYGLYFHYLSNIEPTVKIFYINAKRASYSLH